MTKKYEEMSRRHFLDEILFQGTAALAVASLGGCVSNKFGRLERELTRQEVASSRLDLNRRELEMELEERKYLETVECEEADFRSKKVEQYEIEQRKYLEELEREYDVIDSTEKFERENPGKIPLGQGSDTLELARLLIGEGGEFWNNESKLNPFSSSVLRRAELAKVPIKEVIYDANKFGNHAYSCFNRSSGVFRKVKNPLIESETAWNHIYDHAGNVLVIGKPELDVDHYATDMIPYWAKGEKPVLTIRSHDGRQTRFYGLGDFTFHGNAPYLKS